MGDNAETTPESPTSIWTSRLPKEWASLDEKIGSIPSASGSNSSSKKTCRITVLSKTLDPERGVCKCTFRLMPRLAEEEEEEDEEDLFLAGEESGVVVLELDASSTGTGVAYPFVSPALKVVRGVELLPNSVVRSEDQTMLLPMLTAWTPKLGLADLMLAAAEFVQAHAEGKDDESTTFVPGQALKLEMFGDRLFQGTVAKQGGGVLQRYLGVTDTWLLSVKAHDTKLETVVVIKAQPQGQVSKLKYKRGVSISVEFRDGDRWMFAMPRAAECVEAIQASLQVKGVVGRRTSQAALNHVTRAKACLDEAQRREAALLGEGGEEILIENVQEVCDLYKHAIEKFATVSTDENKQKTAEAITLLQSFLSHPEVQDLLTNKLSPPPPPPSTAAAAGRRLPALPTLPKVNSNPFTPQPKPMKGEVLPRSATAEMASGEDDGLAREEKRLGPLSSRLKELLDLNLNDPTSAAAAAADARDRGDSISSSSGGGAGGGGEGRGGMEGGRHAGTGGGSMDAAMLELDTVLGEANKELESLSSPRTAGAMTTTTGGAEEEEIVI